MNALAAIDLAVVVFVVSAAAGYVVWKLSGKARGKPQKAKLGGTLARAMAKRR